MSAIGRWAGVVGAIFCIGWVPAHFASTQATFSRARNQARNRGRIVFSKPLPKMDGDQLKAVLMEVYYGPGEASPPHSHPCPVIGYVVVGALRTQVKGEPQIIYKAGESFYEAPNAVHLVSANASSAKPAKFVALFVCDHDSPLSIEVHRTREPKGQLK